MSGIELDVFWVLTSCSDAVGYQRFGGFCRLHLQGEVRGVWETIRRVVQKWHRTLTLIKSSLTV